MSTISDIAATIQRAPTSTGFGLEGPPYSGKTTLANRIAERSSLPIIPEHISFSPHLLPVANSPWPRRIEEILERQRIFLEVELARSRAFSDYGSAAVMDRTLISIIAHLYIRTLNMRYHEELMERFLEDCAQAFDAGALAVPRYIVYLETPVETLRNRAHNGSQHLDARNTEPFLLNPKVINSFGNFYRSLAESIPDIVFSNAALPSRLKTIFSGTF
jgi:deoxyadenosine/deoxycytidine kinase